MPEKKPKSSSDCTDSTARASFNLREAGDFIERVKTMGATAVVVGDISVRFPDVLGAPPRRAKTQTDEERLAIQEHSA